MSPRISKEEKLLAVAGLVLISVAVGLALKSRSESKESSPAPVSPVALTSKQHPRSHPSSHPSSHLSWRDMEKGLASLHRKDVDWFLIQTRIPAFEEELNRAEAARKPQKWIDGCHSGVVKLGDGRRWEMSTAISLQKGSSDVALSEKGNVFIHSLGNGGGSNDASGEIRDLEVFDASAALMLEASENIYFQFYPVRDGAWIAGNLYLRSGNGKLAFGGTALLSRTDCRDGSPQ